MAPQNYVFQWYQVRNCNNLIGRIQTPLSTKEYGMDLVILEIQK